MHSRNLDIRRRQSGGITGAPYYFSHPVKLSFFAMAAAAMVLLLTLLFAAQAHAQQSLPTITIDELATNSDDTSVPVGTSVAFNLSRSGDLSGNIHIRLVTLNSQGFEGFGVNPTEVEHHIRFRPGVSMVTVRVVAVGGIRGRAGSIDAQFFVGSGYQLGASGTNQASVRLRPATASDEIITIAANSESVTEGEAPTYTLTRTGPASDELNVFVDVSDPGKVMRGNHWNPAPSVPSGVTFAEGSTTATLSLATSDDSRDIDDSPLTVTVTGGNNQETPVGNGYWVPVSHSAVTTVTDNDTAPSLLISRSRESVIEGETLTFYVISSHLESPSSQPVAQDVPVDLRITHDRAWTDPNQPRREFINSLVLKEGTTNIAGPEVTVPDNQLDEDNWVYTGTIVPHSSIPEDEVAQYYSVLDDLSTTVRVFDAFGVTSRVSVETRQTRVQEGASVGFTVSRVGDTSSAQTVRMRAVEPNHPDQTANSNPTEEYVEVVFAAGSGTAGFSVSAAQEGTPTNGGSHHLLVEVDPPPQASYFLGEKTSAQVLVANANDDDIYVSVSGQATVEEGAGAAFTFVRTGDLSGALTVPIAVVDPNFILRGNHWEEDASIRPTIMFSPGSSSVSQVFTTKDDWRETGDSPLSVTLAGGNDGQGNGDHGFWVGNPYRATTVVSDNDTAPEVSVSVDRENINEGENIIVIVSRSGHTPGNTTRVRLNLSHNRPGSDTNFLPNGSHHTFDLVGDATEASQTFFVFDNNNVDKRFTPGFSWRYTFTIEPPEGVHASQEGEYWTVSGDRTAAVRAKDTGYPRVSIEPGEESVVEDGEDRATFILTRTGNLLRSLEVSVVTLEPNHPDVGDDYFPGIASNRVRFEVGSRTAMLEVRPQEDRVKETDDYLLARVHEIPNAQRPYERGDPYEARIPILNPDITVTIAAAETTIEEGETASFTLTRQGYLKRAVTVNVAVSDPGRFTQGNSWETAPALPRRVTFEARSATATVELPTRDDRRDIPDNDITVTVNEGVQGIYTVGTPSSASVTVTDNDIKPEVTFTVSATEIEEGETAYLTLRRVGNADNPLLFSMDIEPRGDALSTYLIPTGRESLTISIRSEEDDLDEPDVPYEVRLNYIGGESEYYTVVGPRNLEFTFVDDDLPVLSISSTAESYSEGQVATVQIDRVGQHDVPLSVAVRLSQTGSQIHRLYPSFVTGDLTREFQSGSTLDILLPMGQFDGDEPDGEFSFQLLESEEYRIDPARAAGSFVVRDGDPTPVLDVPDVTVSEGDESISFDVSLTSRISPPSLRTVTVDYRTESGTASERSDFTPVSGTLTFNPGESSASISTAILEDSLAEYTETFTLVFSNPVNVEFKHGVEELSISGTITDNEPTVTIEAVADSVAEGEPIEFRINRMGGLDQELTVWYLHGFNDARGEGLSTQRLSWLSANFEVGEDSVTVSLPGTIDDDVQEADRVSLAAMMDPTWLGFDFSYHFSDERVTITIRDNDLPVVTIQNDHVWRVEGKAAEFTLTRMGVLDSPLTVNVTVTGEGSFLGSGAPPSTVTFAADAATASLSVATEDDSTEEAHGSVNVAIAGGTVYRTGDLASALVYLNDNDRGLPLVRISAQAGVMNEGEDVVFNLVREGATDLGGLDVLVRVQEYRSRIGNPGAEFVNYFSGLFAENEHTVTFSPGSHAATLTLATENESYNDGNSYFSARMLPNGQYSYGYLTVRVWVKDDDIPTLTVSPATLEHVESLDRTLAEFFIHRTGDTSTGLAVNVFRTWVSFYAPEYQGTVTAGRVPLRLFHEFEAGEASYFNYILHNEVPPGGGTETVELEPFLCEEAPEPCGLRPQYRVGEEKTVFATIHNNYSGLRLTSNQSEVTEGETASFTLTRYGGPPKSRRKALDVMVRVTQRGEFIEGAPPQTVRFAGFPDVPGTQAEDTVTLEIPTVDDELFEGDGAITVTIVLDPDPLLSTYELENNVPVTATVLVEDDELPTVSIADAEADESAGGLEFTVTTQSHDERITVDWATSNGAGDNPATAGEDYTAATGALTFEPGETSKTFRVATLDDAVYEGDETLTVTLTNPVEAELGTATATGTITDNDVAVEVTIRSPHGSPLGGVVDSTEGFVVFNYIWRNIAAGDAPSSSITGDPLTVNLAVTQEGDYILGEAPTSVAIPAGQRYALLVIRTDDDSVAEPDGTITVTLETGSNYAVGEPGSSVVNLLDNDSTVSIADATGWEREQEVVFTVSLSGPLKEEVTVDVETVDGAATSGSGATPTSLGQDFESKSETLTFAAGETEKTFTVTVVNDTFDEPGDGEEFTVRLSNPSSNATLADDTATGTITDDDQKMMVGVVVDTIEVPENQQGPASVMLRLTPAASSLTTAIEQSATVEWKLEPGTALFSKDYETEGGTTTFPLGVTEAAAEVVLIDDQEFEALKETFVFTVLSGSQMTVDASKEHATIAIVDDDVMQASVAADAQAVTEGEDATYTVTLAGAVSTADTVVTYTLGGTAGKSDYTDPNIPEEDATEEEEEEEEENAAPGGSITIPAGETTGAITIETLTDDELDPDETLTVTLTGAESNERAVPRSSDVATTTLLEAGVLSAFIALVESASEGSPLSFAVHLSHAATTDVTVDVKTEQIEGQANAARAGFDYTANNDSYTIKAGNTKQKIAVDTINDNLVEEDELVRVVLTGAQRGSQNTPVALGTTSAVGTILDDDGAPTALNLIVTPPGVTEGVSPAVLTVTAIFNGTTALLDDVTAEVRVEDGTATRREDYTARRVPLTIDAGKLSGTAVLTTTLVNDNLYEGDETFSVTASAADMTVNPVVVTITDNDLAPTGVALSVDTRSVREGAGETELTVTATFEGGVALPRNRRIILDVEGVSLPPEDQNGSPTVAATSDDFTHTGVTLTIPAGETTGTATVMLTPTNDILAEGPETLQVTGRSRTGVALPLDVAAAPLTLEDNDQEPNQIRLSVVPATVNEDAVTASIQVTAAFDGESARLSDTSVALSVEDLTAATGDDYTMGPVPSLAIPAGELSGTATISLTIVEDTMYEGEEDIGIRGANADPGLPVAGARISIADNDINPDVISLTLDKDTIGEGDGQQTQTVTAALEGDSSRPVITVVRLSLGEGTATADDFTGLGGTVNIPAGDMEGKATVVVSATDDAIDEGDETLEVRGETPGQHFFIAPVLVTITDNDTDEVLVSPTEIDLAEGGQASYTVVLATQPDGEVTVTPSASSDSGVTVSPVPLRFSPNTWSAEQAVTVSAAQDDDAQGYTATISHTAASPGDSDYDGSSVDPVTVTVTDDDSLSVVIAPTAISVLAGGSNTYFVVMGSQPAGNVEVTPAPAAESGLTVTGPSQSEALVFSTATWNIAQTVTVSAATDAVASIVAVSHSVSSVDDSDYNGLEAKDVAVSVLSFTEGTPIIQLGVTTSDLELTVPEGGSNSYSMVLSHRPSGDVTVTVNNPTDNTDVTATPGSLTFTTEDWDTAQPVTVEAAQDDDTFNDTATVTHAVSGGGYGEVSAPNVGVTVDDDETVSIVLAPTELTVNEGDADGESYTVKLSHEPSEEVTVTVSGQASTDLALTGLSATNTLTFTTTNWDAPQTVTVTAGEDEDAANDSVTLAHTAAEGEYEGVSSDLAVTVDDDETVSIVLAPTELTVDEGDADGGTYTVKLSHELSEDVTVTVSGQASTDLALTGLSATNTLTFTTTNWDAPQTVTVTAGEDEDAANDSVTLAHTAAEGEYAGVSSDLAVTVDDDETVSIVLAPTELTVDEGDADGGTYTVKLSHEPSEEVTVTVSGQASTDLALTGLSATNTLTFTTTNWDAPQTVTVTAGQDDDGSDDSVTLTHTSAGGEYEGVSSDLAVTVDDDETVSIVLAPTELTVDEGDADGGTYTVKLSHEPSEEVTVTVSGQASTDLALTGLSATNTLTFTTTNWDAPQTVTVTAGEDEDAANDSVTLAHTAAEGEYAGVSSDLAVTVDDDETVSIVLAPTELTVDEGDADGGTYTVKLSHEPSEEVTVTVSGQASTDLALTGLSATNTLTFTTTNWDAPQTVTVTAGQDDDGSDDSVTLTHTSAGGEYEGVSSDLAVTVDDDETVSIVLAPTELTVDEGDADGGTYTVKLSHEPSEEVTVTVSGQASTDLALTGLSATNTLTFTTTNWDAPQTVTVTAGEDEDAANDSVTLAHTAAEGEYAGVSSDLAVTVDDDETVSIVLAPTELTVDEGDADGGTYTVKLSHEPSEEVTVTVSGQASTDLALTGLSATNTLTFTTTNWDAPQTVTVTAGEDEDAANDSVTLAHTAAEGEYAGVSSDLAVTVDDDETVSIVLAPTELTVNEGDADGESYTVKLSHEPSEEVTVTVSGQASTDLALTGLSATNALTFTTTNWDAPQTVTVTAGEDEDAANDSVTLAHTAAEGEYAGVSSDLAVTVDDDETVSIVLAPTELTVNEGDADGGTYTVKLSHEPSEDVTVTVSGQASTDLALTGLSTTNTLTFTDSNWDAPQTVTVTAGQDDDGSDDSVTLTHTSAGGEYEGVSSDLAVTVDDDETTQALLTSVQARFSTGAIAIPEGDAAIVVVSLSDALTQDVTIPLTRTNQTGAGDADYSGVPASLTFESGDTEQSFTFSATVDLEDEDEEQVVLGFGTLPEGVGQGTVSQATITIQDVPSVSFGASEYSATEGGEDALVTVQLSEALLADVTVPLTAEGGGGATAEDWSGVPAEVTFSAGEASKTFTVVAVDDTVEDDGEMVNLGFGTLPAGLNAGPPASATVTLMNVEDPSEDPCEHVWCATVVLKWAHAGSGTTEPVPILACAPTCPGSSITNEKLSADGVEYTIGVVAAIRDIRPGNHNWSRFRFGLSGRDPVTHDPVGLTEQQIQSWTLYINDDIQLALSSATDVLEGMDFVWFGETFYDFVEDTVLEMRIEANDAAEAVSIVVSEPTPVDEGNSYGRPYTVKLSHQPSQDVTVTVSGQDGTDLTLTGLSSANTLTFTTENWDTAQQVMVFADEDDDAANDLVTLVHTGSGGEYAGVSADLAVTVYDDDKVSIVLRQAPVTVAEGDAAGQTYTVELSDEPSVVVTVTVSGHVGTDLTLVGLSATNTLTFTATNWDTPQTVTVTGGQDSDDADDVVTLTHTASGGEYGGVSADLGVRVDDDEDEDAGNAPVENTAATGQPTISGTPAVGETLTADTSDIEDINGLTNAEFSYQWVRYDGSSDTDIADATGATYKVTEADVGYEIEVRVSFTDDAGFEETVTSNSVYVQPPQPLYGGLREGPESHDGSTAFTLELYFSEEVSLGFEAVRDHVLDVTGGSVTAARRLEPGSETPNMRWEITVTPNGNADVTVTLPATTDCAAQGAVCTQGGKMLSNQTSITVPGPGETQEQRQEETPANMAATGQPAINGTAQVGETLTASTSGIDDEDGLDNATFSYQWIGNDGSTDTDIQDATGSSYTLVAVDQGKAIIVRVSFTDDGGNNETLTSAATAAVAGLPPLTASFEGTPSSHDGETAFTFELRFSVEVSLSYETLRDHAFTVTGGTVENAQRLEKPSNIGWRITVEPDSSATVAVVLPITENCDDQGAICTGNGRMLSNRLELTVSGPSQ